MGIFSSRSRSPGVRIALIAIVLFVWITKRYGYWDSWFNRADPSSTIEQAWQNKETNTWLEAEGTVERILEDDTQDSRHQRFIIRLPSGLTLLVSHNIDLAPRVPLKSGDPIRLRGQYEWNQEGGVIHWTHHDPQGKLDGGWISHNGKDYR